MRTQSEKQSKNSEISDLLSKTHQGDAPTHKKKPQQGIEPHEYQKQLMDTVNQALKAYDELAAEFGANHGCVLRFKNGVDMVRSIAHVVERKQSLPTDTQLTAGTLVPFMPKEDQRQQMTDLRIRHAIINREANLVAELSDIPPCYSCKYATDILKEAEYDGTDAIDENWRFYLESTFDAFVSSIKEQHRKFLKFSDGRDLLDRSQTVHGYFDLDDSGKHIEGVGRWRRKTTFKNGKEVVEVVAVETKDGEPIDQAA